MILGHQKIFDDLKRLSESGELSHGYLFHGPQMIGKKTLATEFARYLEEGKVGGKAILQDVLVIAPDEKGSIGIDESRRLKNFLWQKPALSSKRTAIIDDAEFLTAEAQNALLKITEEPPRSSLLILMTSDPESLAPTLLSRLAKIYFSAPKKTEVITWLTENHGLSKKEAEELAERSLGKPGLAVRFGSDKKLQSRFKSAEALLKSGAGERRDFIKKILEDESFNIAEFLDTIIILTVTKKDLKKNYEFWHKLLKLRMDAAYLNLNPRLQLENLLQ